MAKEELKKEEPGKDFKYLVRIANTDLDGNKPIQQALRKIKGIDFMFANAVCSTLSIDISTKVGNLKDEDIKRIDEYIRNPSNLPAWMLNRRKDYETNANRHVIGTDLDFARDSDIQAMKRMRSYKGVRHMYGLPVRGQRTKSNFRKKKGKVLGVQRRKDAKTGR
jgi:small subunit ribosomal protein S13